MVKILVLSLKNSSRRNIIKRRLKDIGVNDFIFYDAVDCRDLSSDSLREMFDIDKFSKVYQRMPAKGEIGCTLSHLAMWKYISKSKEQNWIIIEDDAILQPKFKFLLECNNQPDCTTILGRSKYTKFEEIFNYLKFRLKNKKKKNKYSYGIIPNIEFRGTVGYFITKDDATKLAHELGSYPFFMTDDFRIWNSVVTVKSCRPFLVYEDFKNLKSDIEQERATK